MQRLCWQSSRPGASEGEREGDRFRCRKRRSAGGADGPLTSSIWRHHGSRGWGRETDGCGCPGGHRSDGNSSASTSPTAPASRGSARGATVAAAGRRVGGGCCGGCSCPGIACLRGAACLRGQGPGPEAVAPQRNARVGFDRHLEARQSDPAPVAEIGEHLDGPDLRCPPEGDRQQAATSHAPGGADRRTAWSRGHRSLVGIRTAAAGFAATRHSGIFGRTGALSCRFSGGSVSVGTTVTTGTSPAGLWPSWRVGCGDGDDTVSLRRA